MRNKVSLENKLQLEKGKPKTLMLSAAALLLLVSAFICGPYISAQLKASAASSGNIILDVGINDAWATLKSSGRVNMNTTPVSSSAVIVQKANVIASTNAPTGYKLYLSGSNTSDTTTADLVNQASEDIRITPLATDTIGNFERVNTWGYAVKGNDAVSGFSDIYSSGTFTGTTGGTFKGVVANNSGAGATANDGLIAESDIPVVNGSVTDVYYAVHIGNTTTAGIYNAKVTYTMVADFVNTTNPNDPNTNPGVDPNKPAGSDDNYAYRDEDHYYYFGDGNYYYYDTSGSKVTAQGVNKGETVASVVADGNITWAAVAVAAGASATFLAIALLRDREDEDEE